MNEYLLFLFQLVASVGAEAQCDIKNQVCLLQLMGKDAIQSDRMNEKIRAASSWRVPHLPGADPRFEDLTFSKHL